MTLPGVAIERLHTGMLWAEGPVYFPAGDFLMWSDIPNNRLWQWVPDLGCRIFSHNSNNSNGNTTDLQGRLISCQHLVRSVVRTEWDGSQTVLARHHAGKPLNSPNDVVVTKDGSVWFTDPSYGILSDYEGKQSVPEQDGCYVYRIDPDTGDVVAKITSLKMPNGLAFSPDGKTLYVADSSRSHFSDGYHHIFAWDVGENDSLSNKRVFAEIEHGVPDGIRTDTQGNLWSSSARGVETYGPDGSHKGYIAIPETVSNLCFGGKKRNRLFITASSSVYAVYVAVTGGA
ncbi:gluconolactonase [Cohaesibacter celericrescens]|uniref:Gluconolactonase n=2 Tax=Cohaesibacter celericrescens TaxID=2067669 RepID=A0A2N5XMP4_9HYPH|nr:SMP-30/gluconolactonase/LRE family protein [Cohaesibacter celericrescens]PLW75752.1 gluconolactonase [Cohaesibacter celericrescens]